MMFANTNTFIVQALAVVVLTTITSAAPTAGNLEERAPNVPPTATVCIDTSSGCVNIPFVPESCTDFTGGLSFLDKEITTAVIPPGFACTFFSDFGCPFSEDGSGEVFLQGGTWDFFSVPGAFGSVDFNDQSSSFICSAV